MPRSPASYSIPTILLNPPDPRYGYNLVLKTEKIKQKDSFLEGTYTSVYICENSKIANMLIGDLRSHYYPKGLSAHQVNPIIQQISKYRFFNNLLQYGHLAMFHQHNITYYIVSYKDQKKYNFKKISPEEMQTFSSRELQQLLANVKRSLIERVQVLLKKLKSLKEFTKKKSSKKSLIA